MGKKDVTNKRTYLRELRFIHKPVILCTDGFLFTTAPTFFLKSNSLI